MYDSLTGQKGSLRNWKNFFFSLPHSVTTDELRDIANRSLVLDFLNSEFKPLISDLVSIVGTSQLGLFSSETIEGIFDKYHKSSRTDQFRNTLSSQEFLSMDSLTDSLISLLESHVGFVRNSAHKEHLKGLCNGKINNSQFNERENKSRSALNSIDLPEVATKILERDRMAYKDTSRKSNDLDDGVRVDAKHRK